MLPDRHYIFGLEILIYALNDKYRYEFALSHISKRVSYPQWMFLSEYEFNILTATLAIIALFDSKNDELNKIIHSDYFPIELQSIVKSNEIKCGDSCSYLETITVNREKILLNQFLFDKLLTNIDKKYFTGVLVGIACLDRYFRWGIRFERGHFSEDFVENMLTSMETIIFTPFIIRYIFTPGSDMDKLIVSVLIILKNMSEVLFQDFCLSIPFLLRNEIHTHYFKHISRITTSENQKQIYSNSRLSTGTYHRAAYDKGTIYPNYNVYDRFTKEFLEFTSIITTYEKPLPLYSSCPCCKVAYCQNNKRAPMNETSNIQDEIITYTFHCTVCGYTRTKSHKKNRQIEEKRTYTETVLNIIQPKQYKDSTIQYKFLNENEFIVLHSDKLNNLFLTGGTNDTFGLQVKFEWDNSEATFILINTVDILERYSIHMHLDDAEQFLRNHNFLSLDNNEFPNLRRVRNKFLDINAWILYRNNLEAKINWQFTKDNARIKLKRLYPSCEA